MGRPPKPAYLASLIEHESCLSLKHPRCWNPQSRLRSAREEGAGLGQLTRAFNQNGSIRFDALSELKGQHPQLLRDLSWSTIYSRPDLQIRATVLKMQDNYKTFPTSTPFEAYAFSDAAYNGGLGGVNMERRACKLTRDCDPNRWFDHVERLCLKSKVALYGQRSACDINRYHVRDVMLTRATKYEKLVR